VTGLHLSRSEIDAFDSAQSNHAVMRSAARLAHNYVTDYEPPQMVA
jgi:hypothetical protein